MKCQPVVSLKRREKIVEDLGPGPGVQDAAVGEHAVEVEQAGGDAVGQSEHLRRHRHGGEPRQRIDAGQPSELGQQLRRLESLLHEFAAPAVRVGDVHRAVCRGQRVVGGVERQLPAHGDRVQLRRAPKAPGFTRAAARGRRAVRAGHASVR